jgi:hypothetical protein
MDAVWMAMIVTMGFGLVRATPPADETVPTIHLFVQKGVDAQPLVRVPQIAGDMLAAAGVRSRWRVCTAAAPCRDIDGVRPTVTVIIRGRQKAKVGHRCATAWREPSRATGTVVVHYECVADVVHAIRHSQVGRSTVRLSTLQVGDVVGLVVAHEIGHVAGLPHADGGVMHARLDASDILAFREGAMAFGRGEAATLRSALVLSQPVSATARRVQP